MVLFSPQKRVLAVKSLKYDKKVQKFSERLRAIGSDLSGEEKADVTHYLRRTPGTIADLFAPLSVTGLGHLLGLETEEVEQTLAALHSILDVPSGTERLIRLHHPSFRDFLHDRSRYRNEALYVDKFAMHSMLADRSL